MPTLLASSHFVKQTQVSKKPMILYTTLLLVALAIVFMEAAIIFDIIDLLTFALIALNMLALVRIMKN